jgi:CPA2 family monovalent cation:H+ antiporter-2
MNEFLLLAFVFLVSGVIAVPVASRFGLGSVLGYLIAGIVISPVLHALHVDVISIQHFAEFGVVMMLFLVGLELEPAMLWAMRAKLFGLGGLQVGVTTALVMLVAMMFGQPWPIALAIGLVLALSSTAIVLQTLNEKGLMKSDGGQAGFSVLLFQDIAVIPMLAFIPLLAMPELIDVAGDVTARGSHDTQVDHHGLDLNIVAGLQGWQAALVTAGAIAAVILGGTYLTRPIFRFIAMAGLRELFVATALLFVIGIALLMMAVGLSPALGTFLAGVVLANSEYRHELESDIDPFRGLLLGLFFITVGAGINFGLLFGSFGIVIGMTLGLIALKFGVLLALAKLFKLTGSNKWLFSLSLAQAGEFGFVLLSFTVANQVIPQPVADQLLLVVALSMLLTPVLFIIYEKLIVPRFAGPDDQPPDEVDEAGDIIIAGHGRYGGIVNRMLRAAGYSTTVLDYSASHLEVLRTFGFKIFYGDATRTDLLHAAGIHNAKLIVIAIDGREQINTLVRYVRKHHPELPVVVRAVDRQHVHDLYANGCHHIIRETFDSSVRTGRTAFELLGVHPFQAELLARKFTEDDRHILKEMAEVYDPDIPNHENTAYIEKSRILMDEREAQIFGKGKVYSADSDAGWAPPQKKDVDAIELHHKERG